jgi:hypothetical protein
VYSIAARLDPDATIVSADLLDAHSQGFCKADRRAVVLMLKAVGPHLSVRSDAAQALESIGAPVNVASIREAGSQILQAKAEAQARAGLISHPLATASGDPLSRLMSDEAVLAIRSALNPATPPAASPSNEMIDSPYLTMDTRRFSRSSNRGSRRSSVRRLERGHRSTSDHDEGIWLRAFGWVTGDKRLCDYLPADAELFGQTLEHLPKTFRWGTANRQSACVRDVHERPPWSKVDIGSGRRRRTSKYSSDPGPLR